MRRLLLLFLSLAVVADAFRLSVPRVLLPYHPENQVNFLLEVTDPEGGCFTWRSSRTDIVSVEVMNSSATGCSDKAIITSRSRFPNEETSVIFAENQGISLTCDVTVDVISSIMITTTTKVLFVDAAPALLIIEAFNKDDDRFSTLGNIPFDWFFTLNEGRPLHIVPFSQSTYKMPFSQSKYDSTPEIEELERQKLKGYAVLVEGISTGSAQLSAKFHEEHFNNILANTIDLFVLANVMLVPSYDLYLPLHAVVKYGAVITQKGLKENLKLPMNEYHLKLSNESVCGLDVDTSTVIAKSIGTSEISLIDTHMKPKSGIKPRSAHIFVVEPDSIRFTIDRGNSWFLQLTTEYQISVKLSDPLGNSIHIPDNAIFSTLIPETYFKILDKSKNGTHFRVQTKKTGKLSIKSLFISLIDKRGKEKKLSSAVTGEQHLEILTPISIVPNVILFPYNPKHRYQLQLKATGGSGIYYWRTSDQSVVTVSENNGLMKSGKIGEATITAHDAYNSLNLATANIFITEPYELQFGQSVVEAEIGSKLTLYLKLLGQSTSGLMPFTDCRHAELLYSIDDPKVFAIDENVPAVVPAGEGCTTVTLRALSEGDTKLSVSFYKHKASVYISAYSPLKVNIRNDLLLTLGGAEVVSFEGGPRPWMLDNSKYSTNVVADKSDVAYASSANGQNFKVFCRNKISDSYLTLKVGNRKSVDNPFPAMATGKIRICCAVPSSLKMSSMRAAKNALPVCPAFSHSIYFKAPVTLELNALGRCVSDPEGEERPFDSIASLDVQYLSKKEIILVKELSDENKGSKLYAQAVPQGVSGLAEIEALISHFYELGSGTPKQKIAFPNAQFRASIKLNLVDFARPNPSSLVLWNDKSVKSVVKIAGGSGHFWIDSEAVASKLSATLHSDSGTKDSAPAIEIVPKSGGISQITLYDLCIEGSKAIIDVKVTDISGIHVNTNSFVKTGSDVKVRVAILDVDGKPFSSADIGDMEIFLTASPTSSDSELVLKNLVTKQVLRYPINLKLSHVLPQTSTVAPVVRPIAEVRPIVQEIKAKQQLFSDNVFNVREIMASFFDAYNSFVLSTFVLLITILLFTGAYRFGIFSPFAAASTSGISYSPKLSPIQPLQTFDRPMFHSTPGNASDNNSSGGNRFSSPSNRRSLLEEPLNASNYSAGSADDPYLWTTNNDLDKPKYNGSGSVINRFYK